MSCRLRSVSCRFPLPPTECVILVENRKLKGFLSNPIVSRAAEKAVRKPVDANLCTLITLSYLDLRIRSSRLRRFLSLSCFLFQTITSWRNGWWSNKDSFPFLNMKSISASGKRARNFSMSGVASTTSPMKADWMIRNFCKIVFKQAKNRIFAGFCE